MGAVGVVGRVGRGPEWKGHSVYIFICIVLYITTCKYQYKSYRLNILYEYLMYLMHSICYINMLYCRYCIPGTPVRELGVY